jgi:hypothetical protein
VDVLNDGFRAVVTRMAISEPHRERVTRPAGNDVDMSAGKPSRITTPIVASSTSSPPIFDTQARGPWDEPQKVAAGTARLDEALDRLVPASYRIVVDDGIPAQVVLVWPSGADWERVVRAALDPIGIELQVREAEKVVHLRRAAARAYVGRIKRMDDETNTVSKEQQKPAAAINGITHARQSGRAGCSGARECYSGARERCAGGRAFAW